MYAERLARRLDISAPTASFHLKKLEEIGMVTSRKEQYYAVYSLCREVLDFNALDAVLDFGINEDAQALRDETYKQGVLSAFFEHGKLKTIPAQLKKKGIVLAEIVKVFEKNREYTEKEVNLIMADFNEDFAALRRYMIEFRLMVRENGIYTVIDK